MKPPIALTGRSGTGKTTIADHLVARHGYFRCSTGNACRQICRSLFGSESKTLLNAVTEKMKEIDPDVWLRAALVGVPSGAPVVFDSMRFVPDWNYLAKLGFKTIRVTAPQQLRIARLRNRGQIYDPDVDDLHPAEVELEHHHCDAVISNDFADTIQLYAHVDTVFYKSFAAIDH